MGIGELPPIGLEKVFADGDYFIIAGGHAK